jgi:hypothetical protein
MVSAQSVVNHLSTTLAEVRFREEQAASTKRICSRMHFTLQPWWRRKRFDRAMCSQSNPCYLSVSTGAHLNLRKSQMS